MRRLFLPAVLIFVCLAPAVRAQTPEEKKATIAYLQKLQQSEGGFLPAATAPAGGAASAPGLRATSSALRALKYFGGEAKDRDAAAKFVERAFDKNTGGFIDVLPGGMPDVNSTAVGLMAVTELKLPADRFVEPAVKYLAENVKTFEDIRIAAAGLEAVGKRPPQADAWLELIARMRNPDGTYGKGDGTARDTGSAVVAVLRLGGKVDQRDNVVKALKMGQRADGAFGKADAKGSDLESTYRIMRAFVMLQEKPADVEALRAFIAKCRNDDGGYGVAPGQPSTVSGTYFAGIIGHWLDGK